MFEILSIQRDCMIHTSFSNSASKGRGTSEQYRRDQFDGRKLGFYRLIRSSYEILILKENLGRRSEKVIGKLDSTFVQSQSISNFPSILLFSLVCEVFYFSPICLNWSYNARKMERDDTENIFLFVFLTGFFVSVSINFNFYEKVIFSMNFLSEEFKKKENMYATSRNPWI